MLVSFIPDASSSRGSPFRWTMKVSTHSHIITDLAVGSEHGPHSASGAAIAIWPSAQRQAARVQLPFEEEDLKTAGIRSKVLLLADDASIQDPTTLSQFPPRPRQSKADRGEQAHVVRRSRSGQSRRDARYGHL